MWNTYWLPRVALIAVVTAMPAGVRVASGQESVDYQRQVKPLLERHCVDCHGAEEQSSGLRLDAGQLAVRGGDRGPAVIAGKSDKSLLFQALLGQGDLKRMPLDQDPLNERDIAILRNWIDQGAAFPADEPVRPAKRQSDHWSFQPLRRPPVPALANGNTARNAIDAFVLQQLAQRGVRPSPEADRATLIRRLSLDLLGLPPTLEDTRAFVNDRRPDAYDRLVDSLLSSPKYGERWGRHWLDIARYADSNGFTIDSARSIWKYRDWVVSALNRDMPFDQFTIEQLAGDLLENARVDQIVATGFHRNTLINEEGGTDKEQFRVEAVVDRVSTTGVVFLGLSLGCARCHAHKFDPISQRDFYQLFGVFNSTDEYSLSSRQFRVPAAEQTRRLAQLKPQIDQGEQTLAAHDRQLLERYPEWEAGIAAAGSGSWTSVGQLKLSSQAGSTLTEQDDQSVFLDFSGPDQDTFVIQAVTPATLKRITAVRLEALTHPSLPKMGPGRAANGNFVLSEFQIAVQDTAGKPQPLELVQAVADHSQAGHPVSAAIDGNEKTGWAINVKTGSLNVNREAVFFPGQALDCSEPRPLTVKLIQRAPGKYLLGRFRLSFSDAPPEALKVPAALKKLVAIPAEKRTKPQQTQLENAFKLTDPSRKPIAKRVADHRAQWNKVEATIPTTYVMQELEKPRETRIHIRGDFLRPGAAVTPTVPVVLQPRPPAGKPLNRLDLARWLVDPQNPLTARVTANRIWQRFFGIGLVETENDFGSQGARPTHPRLLDWLATELIRRRWSLKSLQRVIVTSATYRQASHHRSDLAGSDPGNRWLARQSRLRLEAESIRDVFLASSGLLFNRMGGPPVHPPQPPGIYVLTQQKKPWPEDKGPDRYRRAIYTYFWRSSPDPFMSTFDAPKANTSCTRRTRSNTPLQALTLSNDRGFFEIAQGLAARVLRESSADDRRRINYAFRLCLARTATDQEQHRIAEFLQAQREHFAKHPAQARQVPPPVFPQHVPLPDAAAWSATARVLMNLDEFITRE